MISTRVFVKHPDLALVPTIRSLPDVDLGVVSDAGTDPQHDAHFFWVETRDFEAFERELAADHTVESFSEIAQTESGRAYRITYSDEAKLVTPSVADVGGLVMESRSKDDGWLLELQLQSHDALYDINAFARREDVRFDVLELHQAEDTDVDSGFPLTEPQIEALMTAYVHGYYDEPRSILLSGLSDLLGISETAVSGRLRRGSARLIEATLVDSEDDR
ncbi:helix-turn-helix domain-containing protein [Halobacterium bonnevillei]|uniref:Bacterio-opsin activator n=1 Tax=Halobacterium bonnevillei TaxID=2692200 RepID=A0A6B0SLA7_9EURY|nr:helix-turn-helix domain-containing protein [Halobacterium bonnevillei]MXR19670.1 bacterio-opsin activator [Halobacterium bonnevillei]